MPTFSDNITNLYSQAGRQWLKSLPQLIAQLSLQWNLHDLCPIPNLTYHYVVLGIRGKDKRPIVLKIGPDRKILEAEAQALQVYGGHGAVHVLEIDLSKGALLLEKLMPGQSIRMFFPEQDEYAVQHAISVMKQLHSLQLAADPPFKTVQKLLQGLNRVTTINERELDLMHLP